MEVAEVNAPERERVLLSLRSSPNQCILSPKTRRRCKAEANAPINAYPSRFTGPAGVGGGTISRIQPDPNTGPLSSTGVALASNLYPFW